MVGYYHQQLFDAGYDLMVEWFEGETLNLANKKTRDALIQVVWSFALAGYHRRYESFAAFLDYALFGERADLRTLHLRRLAQVADAVLEEAPETEMRCQYPDRLVQARSEDRVRQIVKSDPVS